LYGALHLSVGQVRRVVFVRWDRVMLDGMPDWLYNSVFPITRWLHLVFTGVLVGGVLFYEFVIPQALDELKDEHQMSVFGRVRWYFSKVVYVSALIILLTGAVSAWMKWETYQESHAVDSPGFWFVLHAGIGLASLAIALRLTLTPRMPPLSWMRANFVLLLVVIFLASVARHVQIAPGIGNSTVSQGDDINARTRYPRAQPWPNPAGPTDDTTQPSTLPAE